MKEMKQKINLKVKKNSKKTKHFCEWDTQCGNEKMMTKCRKKIIFCNKIIKALEMITELCQIKI
jgi:hypothetical protein